MSVITIDTSQFKKNGKIDAQSVLSYLQSQDGEDQGSSASLGKKTAMSDLSYEDWTGKQQDYGPDQQPSSASGGGDNESTADIIASHNANTNGSGEKSGGAGGAGGMMGGIAAIGGTLNDSADFVWKVGNTVKDWSDGSDDRRKKAEQLAIEGAQFSNKGQDIRNRQEQFKLNSAKEKALFWKSTLRALKGVN